MVAVVLRTSAHSGSGPSSRNEFVDVRVILVYATPVRVVDVRAERAGPGHVNGVVVVERHFRLVHILNTQSRDVS